jgi:hypothetical protein
MLRTSFDVESWKFPVQVVRRGESMDNVMVIDVVDGSGGGESGEEKKEEEERLWDQKEGETRPTLQSYLSLDRKRGMDVVGRAPLLRAAVVRESRVFTSPTTSLSHFVLTIHHIIFDGWSLGLMLEELQQMYANPVVDDDAESSAAAKLSASDKKKTRRRKEYEEEETRISTLSTTRLLSYLQWERRKDTTRSLRYWRNLFHGYQPSPRRPRISSSSFSSSRHVARLGTSVAASIRDVARLWGVTPNAIAQACFVLAMREDNGKEEASNERSHFEMV